MYFELQLSASVFTRIVRNRLKALPLCVDRELTDPDGNRLVVDQVVIGESTWIQREQTIEVVNGLPKPKDIATQVVWIFSPKSHFDVTVPFLQVKQEVSIHLVKSSDLDANGPNETPAAKTLTIYPVFNVSLDAANPAVGRGGPLSLSYSLAHVDFGALILGLSAAQRAEIQEFIAGVRLPTTTVDLGPLTPLLDRPVAAINAGITCDPAGSFVALRADFDVYASPIAVSREFFEAGPTNLLAGKEWAMLIDAHLLTQDATQKAKGALEANPKVRLRSGPAVSWDPGGPAIDIRAGVELINACPFFVDDLDMDADVYIRTSFSVPTPNTLRTHYYLNGTPSDWGEKIGCALTAALLWPFIGPLLLEDEENGLAYYLAGLVANFVIGPNLTFIGLIAAIETKGSTDDLSKRLGSTCHKQDDKNYECNDPLNIMMQLSPPFHSRLELNHAYGVPEGLVIAGLVRNLPERFRGKVAVTATPLDWTLSGTCRGGFGIVNKAEIEVAGTLGGALCKAYLLSDPLNEFALTTEDGVVTVTPRFQPAYASDPYVGRVRVVTTAGVRTITLPPHVAITDAERQNLENLREGLEELCDLWKDTFTKAEFVGWEDPGGPVDLPSIRFWQLVVKGMRRDETIRVGVAEGETVMTARPSRAGVAHFSMMFPGDRAPSELSLELLGRREEGVAARELSHQQVLFEHRATLPARGPLRSMQFEVGTRGRRLIVVDEDREMTWDVAVPLAPALLRSTARADGDGRDDGIVFHSGKRVGGAPTPNLLRALQGLSDRNGPPEVVGSPRVGGITEALYVRTEQGAALFDVSDPEEPREMHTYQEPAWYEGIALGGALMARHDRYSNTVELYAASSTKIL